MAAPDIFRYLDFRAFLSDWFAARQAEDPSFSRRSFARLAGKSSPGLLTEVLHGRQLTSPMVAAFSKAMKLRRAESEFFDALVQLDQSSTTDDRNVAWERISAARPFQQARAIEGASFRYLSEWWIPVVKELAHRPDFRADPRWIAARIRPAITEAQARTALDTLVELGMFVRDTDGELRPAHGLVVTPHEVGGLAVHNYHRGMLARALDAIDGVAPEDRHFLAGTVSVPHALVSTLKVELNAFHKRIMELCGVYEDDAEEVLQVHLLLFPLSDRARGGSK